jgi:hypothetical protein
MGLDAVVFKSAARMENEFGRKGFNVDLKTGEAIPVMVLPKIRTTC